MRGGTLAANGPYFVELSTWVFSVRPCPRVGRIPSPTRGHHPGPAPPPHRQVGILNHRDEGTSMTVEQAPGETGQITSKWHPIHEAIVDRRRMAPAEKYELFLSVLTGQTTQQEAGERWGIDRSAVVSICMTARQGALEALAGPPLSGLPTQGREAAELAAARAEIERLRTAVNEHAVALGSLNAQFGTRPPRSRSRWG